MNIDHKKALDEIARLRQDEADSKADVLRLHREKMEYFELNMRLQAALEEAKRHIIEGNLIHRSDVLARIDSALGNERKE